MADDQPRQVVGADQHQAAPHREVRRHVELRLVRPERGDGVVAACRAFPWVEQGTCVGVVGIPTTTDAIL